MRNLGPVSRGWLADAGIADLEDLRAVGAIEAWLRIRSDQPRASLNLLYALDGALRDVDWRELPADVKRALRASTRSV